MPKSVRIVVQLPAPQALADFEPFKPVSSGGFGMQTVTAMSDAAFACLQQSGRKLFAKKVTVGWATLPAVKAVFFDMDATVIREESLVELAAFAGVQDEVRRITERAMSGELDFRTALLERVALLKGMPKEEVAKVAGNLTLMPGIVDFVAFCRQLNVPTFMVSGGFVQLAAVVSANVGFDGYHANTLEMDGDYLSGLLTGPIVDGQGKQDYVLSTCLRLGIAPDSVAAVGDGANDAAMLSSVGLAVGHGPRPVLWPDLHACNWTEDHRFLIPLLFGRGMAATRPHL